MSSMSTPRLEMRVFPRASLAVNFLIRGKMVIRMENKDGNDSDCGRIFRDSYSPRGYHPQVKEICLNMYLNGMGFREARKNHRNCPYHCYELGSRIRRRVI